MNSRKLLSVAAISFTLIACNETTKDSGTSSVETEAAPISLETMEEKVSYLIGYSAAQQAQSADMKLNSEIVIRAIQDVTEGLPSKLSEQESHGVGAAFQKQANEKRAAGMRAENVSKGDAFAEQNATRADVVQTASGLQYEMLTAGSEQGKTPKLTDTVRVHYQGSLIDGTVFDSSLESGEPVTFGVNQVIAGWTEVLQLMTEGAKWRVVIPGGLAYPNGTRSIPPGSTLIFEIELLEVIRDES